MQISPFSQEKEIRNLSATFSKAQHFKLIMVRKKTESQMPAESQHVLMDNTSYPCLTRLAFAVLSRENIHQLQG